LHRRRTVSAPRLQTSASSGAQNRHSRCTTLVGGSHPIFVVWRKERIIKLRRAMMRQLLRGAMMRARLPRPSQTKNGAQSIRRMGASERRVESDLSERLTVLSSKDSCRARESMRDAFSPKGHHVATKERLAAMAASLCAVCSGVMVAKLVVPDPRDSALELRTYVCAECGHSRTYSVDAQ
jgi:hypothetical protein